eukprot:CAMPEP_0184661316 /NCGR_PEP_ID=MMETSP0308-20130426/37917_1 /TAXON_ID=38269 /ORGANISM="Gloeochaete witrockiana, Strain SAG 46.84" /LENGTH=309 /DNA_ID=CAMNT_0027102537 /DNA_START=119 /DNA_END=1044 /DNA_ORIENTATION=-
MLSFKALLTVVLLRAFVSCATTVCPEIFAPPCRFWPHGSTYVINKVELSAESIPLAAQNVTFPLFLVETTTNPPYLISTFSPKTDYVSAVLYAFRVFDPEVLLAVREGFIDSPNALFVDAGAHIGVMSLYAAKLGARVVAFEPNDDNRRLLVQNIELNGLQDRVTVLSEALSDAPGESCMYTNAENSGVNFLKGLGVPIGDCERVTITTLSVQVDEYIHFLKIDTEGNDIRVLDGARPIFTRHGWPKYIVMEMYPTRTRLSGREPLDLLHELSHMGYRMYSLFLRFGQEVYPEQFESFLPITDRGDEFL